MRGSNLQAKPNIIPLWGLVMTIGGHALTIESKLNVKLSKNDFDIIQASSSTGQRGL